MKARDVIKAVVAVIRDSGRLPDSTNYIGYEPNIDTDAIKLPLVEVVTTSSARISEHNTDQQGVIEDDSGNVVGKVFHELYQLSIEVNVWTAEGSKYDPNVLSDSVYSALYPYDSSGPGKSLAEDVWRVRIGDGSPDEDFGTSPTLRRWSQEVDIWAYETFTTDEEYIKNVDVPEPSTQTRGDFSDTDGDRLIDNLSPDKDV